VKPGVRGNAALNKGACAVTELLLLMIFSSLVGGTGFGAIFVFVFFAWRLSSSERSELSQSYTEARKWQAKVKADKKRWQEQNEAWQTREAQRLELLKQGIDPDAEERARRSCSGEEPYFYFERECQNKGINPYTVGSYREYKLKEIRRFPSFVAMLDEQLHLVQDNWEPNTKIDDKLSRPCGWARDEWEWLDACYERERLPAMAALRTQ
jgi:hypothetical protein